MINPFELKHYSDESDEALIKKSLAGNKESLNALLQKNQDYIFNIALKMLNVVEEAEDVTQEILIKVVTKLSSFDPNKARFRTWLYRIVFNHILKMKKSAHEKREVTFTKFYNFMEGLPDIPIPQEEEDEIMGVSIKEARIACTAGMLMCLNREQRLTYIVGEIFKIDHHLASEIFEITPDNFRKRLSLARKDLHQWMHKKCGLVNLDNPCRCRNKTKKFIEMGIVNPEKMKWQSNYYQSIHEQTAEKLEEMTVEADQMYANFYRQDPFKVNMSAQKIYDEILNRSNFSKFMNL